MKRAKQLDTVMFSANSLFIREEESRANTIAQSATSAAGTHISYETKIVTPYITLDSKNHGWITDLQKQQIESMYDATNATYILTYTDGTTDTVRFAKEKQIVFTPLFEGSLKYRAVIPLAKTI